MKIQNILFFVLFSIILTSCATAPTTRIDSIPEHDGVKQSNLSNVGGFKEVVISKLRGLSEVDLGKVNAFVDSLWEVKGTRKKVVSLVIEERVEFPPLIEGIIRQHPKLSTLPRDPAKLHVVTSKRTGVRNIFVEVPASAMAPGDVITSWMLQEDLWRKYIDVRANEISDLPAVRQYATLFTEGNNVRNPELIDSVKAQDWNWDRMIHPKDTQRKMMLVPIATMTGELEKFF